GWDAEIGFKVPYTEKCGEVRVFGGYYSWDSELVGGDDLDGFKARLEIRPMPAVTFDAEYYEDEDVFDTNYYAGVRVRVPFNIGSALAGENPFAGAEDAFKWGAQRTFESRMGEMVIRDTYIHTEQGIERPLPVDECENGYEPPPYDNGYETAR
ncbi:MAG: hypothetical protein K9N51_04265, partial [Candidatus Pacebacteria bacterium]|nr:hypothetical protein [Candidatus Paceibacterota bacterium]